MHMISKSAHSRGMMKMLWQPVSEVIRSALLFFPVNDIFINGQWKNLDQIVDTVAKEFPVHPVIRKSGTPDGHVNDSFALRILTENYRRLVEG